ncbi:MAG: hypothetical protein ACOX2L_01655 [Anaerolineae bacterium]|jgi:hypothetical protein|nr:hypothetical protein [Chloroflexota bacterium]
MDRLQTRNQREFRAASPSLVARRALEVVWGLLLVDREVNSRAYEDLFHLPWQ